MTAKRISAAAYRQMAKAPKPRKYRNKPVTVDGERYDSGAEARRHGELRYLEMSGQIRDLKRQVRFELHTWADGQLILLTTYTADFTYRDTKSGYLVAEDVKGPESNDTDVFKLKKKWMAAEHGIDIRIVRK